MISAVLRIKSPSGAESRIRIDNLPFRIGRHGDNELVIRDNRASRHHAQIVAADGGYAVEDLKSSHGVFVNGKRVALKTLEPGDLIEFGVPDSYQVTFELEEAAAGDSGKVGPTGSSNLAKLRATLEVARALQSSLSTEDVLSAVVEAALTITGCDRGFLLLRKANDLEIRIARSRTGPLAKTDLRVPTRLLLRALESRREMLSMNFEPAGDAASPAELSVYNLELRSVVCVPLVRVRTGEAGETGMMSPADDTVGLLYMDSRVRNADLSAGGRELLTTLALEASTVLEHARLLEEQWARQRMEQELRIARQIQESLLPRALPVSGWFRAAASSIPSLEVGGDYVDIRQIKDTCWAGAMVDVSGKGVGAAILASLLQGMFLASPYSRLSIEDMLGRVNRYLIDRTGGDQYATAFYCTLERDGTLRWVNAGHPPPVLLRGTDRLESLPANGTPLGMLEEAEYTVEETRLEPFDRIVIYTDGLTEAQNPAREYFGLQRLRETVLAHAAEDCRALQASVFSALEEFTRGAPQRDDVTLAVLEYRPD